MWYFKGSACSFICRVLERRRSNIDYIKGLQKTASGSVLINEVEPEKDS